MGMMPSHDRRDGVEDVGGLALLHRGLANEGVPDGG